MLKGAAAIFIQLWVASSAWTSLAGSESLQNGYRPPFQTSWQQAQAKAVADRAARKSQEAIPALLGELDAADFRHELHECCPSLADKSAEELLQRLAKMMSTIEVVSGFSASVNSSLSFFTGMSVDDGLTGSYFQSIWQRLVRHNQSFSAPASIFGFANKTTDAEGNESKHYTAWLWKSWFKTKSRKCQTPVEWKLAVSIGACSIDKKDNLTVGAALNASGLVLQMWNLKEDRAPHRLTGGAAALAHSGVFDGEPVPCPQSKPAREIVVPTEAGCHAIPFGSTDIFYKQQDKAETSLYGLKPFARAGHPSTLEEASERGFYSLVNIFRQDAGSPLFGDVSAIFSSSAMRKASIVSAVDTGFQTFTCNDSSSSPEFNLPHDCSAYGNAEGMGTVEHFNHILLANHRFWKPLPTRSPLARIFSRLEGAWGTNPLTIFDLVTYFEIVPAGNFQYPNDIRFLIATFPKLFGTAEGALVQKWAMQRGWVLLWSLGLNLDVELSWLEIRDHEWLSVGSNNRIIDPLVAQHSSASKGLNLSHSMVASFNAKWSHVEEVRSSHQKHAEDISNATWLVQWRQVAAGMEQLYVDPLHPDADCPSAGPGEDAPECVGVTRSGACVCYAHKAPDPPSSVLISV